jgi:hypothetical protein
MRGGEGALVARSAFAKETKLLAARLSFAAQVTKA